MKKLIALSLFIPFCLFGMQERLAKLRRKEQKREEESKQFLQALHAKIYEGFDPLVRQYCTRYKDDSKAHVVDRYVHAVATRAAFLTLAHADPDRAIAQALRLTPANIYEWCQINNKALDISNTSLAGKAFWDAQFAPIKEQMAKELAEEKK